MPILLRKRETKLPELMDLDDCDPARLANTYRQFRTINGMFSQWRTIYKRFIRPELNRISSEDNRPARILDIGFGGADIPLAIHAWAKKDGFDVDILAIDPDERALNYASKLDLPSSITLEASHLWDVLKRGDTFDISLSNHLLHHLPDVSVAEILDQTAAVTTGTALHNDIERSDLAWLGYPLVVAPFFRNSFVLYDGTLSIRKSRTRSELAAVIPVNWTIVPVFPFRLVALYQNQHHGGFGA